MSPEPYAVLAEGVRKTFPGRGAALDGLDLAVPAGTVHGVLGPNGAGKTTAVRILTTLLRPDGGRARVAGHDVATDAARVRASIGVAGQYAAVDEVLTGRQNLEMFARLHHLGSRAARRRADELLAQLGLEAAAGRPVRHYSGGMRRRLDLGVSLIRRPQVLFLDEPTTGLDPRSRSAVWDAVRDLAAGGTTVLLTTQYLEEADRLCARISLVDRGRVVAEGTPRELKARVGASRIEVVVPEDRDLAAVARPLLSTLVPPPDVDAATRTISVPVQRDPSTFTLLGQSLEAAGLGPDSVTVRRPDLDDVFLDLTGHDLPQGAHR